MSRTTLKWLAVILTVLIIVVAIQAFDTLPGALRKQIAAERATFQSAQTQVKGAQDETGRMVQADPDLFRALPFSQQWRSRFDQASGVLQSAGRDLDELTRLEKKGHYSDRHRAEKLLAGERGLRTNAVGQATAIRGEAARYVERKRHLPEELQAAEASYKTIRAFNLAPVATAVQKAQNDWPGKRDDLATRLGVLTGTVSQSEGLWQAANAARQRQDYGALFAASDALQASAAALPGQDAELQALTGQLYDSWDKLLVDMEVRGRGKARAYNQKIRTVKNHAGTATSDERWIDVSPATYQALERNLGMAIEHKAAGKYDSEAERVAQPAGFAYMAPPGQRNQYGYWENRGGQSFWVFYGQYALMRDLLFNHRYYPPSSGQWEEYRTYRGRGQSYYGRDYGTGGTATQERYSGSTFGKSGGFKDSHYASKGGSYGSSRYASKGGDSAPKAFGRRSRPDEPRHAAPPSSSPSRSYRPAPSRSPSSGGGRRFGSGGGGRRR
jgi:hypothetical protein